MRSKRRYLSGLGIMLVSCICMAANGNANAKEISCRAVKKGVDHVAKIVILNDKVESFFYGSVANNGQTCEAMGRRGKAGSVWVDQPDHKTLVSLELDDTDTAKVSLQNSDPDFTIKILTPLLPLCGVNGYIAKTVIVTRGGKTCALRD